MTDTDLYGRGTATLLASFEAYARGARTVEHARRRGLGTALAALHLHDARSRGCRTASVQSTAMAERLYVTAGFRDLGTIQEYVP